MNSGHFWDTLFVIGAAIVGVAARLGHTFSTRKHAADEAGAPARQISMGETIAAAVTAPAMGLIALGVGRQWNMSIETIVGMAGFAGLAGPAMVLGFWDRVIEPAIRGWLGPRRGG